MQEDASDAKLNNPYWPSLGGLVFLFLLALFFFARPLLLLGDGGSCRHYLTGLYILQNHAVPTTTYMSAVEPNAPWVTHELLCDLIFGLPFDQLGLNWIVLTCAFAIALSFTWSYQMARLRGASSIVALTTLVLAIEACTIHWSARPHIFTYLLFLGTYYETFVASRSFAKRACILSGLMFLWGNLHGSFPLGMLMIVARALGDFLSGLAKDATGKFTKENNSSIGMADEASKSGITSTQSATEETSKSDNSPVVTSQNSELGSATAAANGHSTAAANGPSTAAANGLSTAAANGPSTAASAWSLRESAIIFTCAILAACLNLRGASFLTYIIGYLTSPKIQAHSDEWRSIDFAFAGPVWSYLLLFCLLALFWTYSKIKPKLGEFGYVLFLFCISLYAMRLVPYFALAALPAMAAQAGQICQQANLVGIPLLGQLLKSDQKASLSEMAMLKAAPAFTICGAILSAAFLFIPSFKIKDFDPERLPVRAVSYMQEHKIKGLGYIKDNWGAYLYWKLNTPIFIDDKTDFYSQKLIDDYTNIYVNNPSWQKTFDSYKFKFVLIPRGLPLEFALKEEPANWTKSFEDSTAILFTRNDDRKQPQSPLPSEEPLAK